MKDEMIYCHACGWAELKSNLRKAGWILCADGVRLCSFQCQCDYRGKGKRFEKKARGK